MVLNPNYQGWFLRNSVLGHIPDLKNSNLLDVSPHDTPVQSR